MEADTHLHFDCFSGLAGDMFLGACLDAGLPWRKLTDAVASLGIEGLTIDQRRARRGGIGGVRFHVLVDGCRVEGPDPDEGAEDRSESTAKDAEQVATNPSSHTHSPHGRTPAEIRGILESSSLVDSVRDRALDLFSRLAAVEARVHAVSESEVHFHEVGAMDAIVDLVGAAVAYEHFRPARVSCGPINVGSGSVTTAHGELPVPAPATAELLVGMPIYGSGEGELVTPTGAVLLAELVDDFGELPEIVLEATGYGLGQRETSGRANAFRLLRGTCESGALSEEVVVVETEIDNLSGEGFGSLMERLEASPALDVYFTAVQMKKNRPGTLVSVLCRRGDLEEVTTRLLVESGSLGCRYYSARRFEAERRFLEVNTVFGMVRVKEGRFRDRVISRAPEFEDCRRLADERAVTWQEVHQATLAALGPPKAE